MGGGRFSWAVRILAVVIAAEVVASGAALVLRPSPARSAALVRSVPTSTTTTTTTIADDPTTLPPPPSTSSPSTTRVARPVPTLPADPVARLAARLDAALGGVRSCLVVQDNGATAYSRAADATLAPASTQKLLVAAAALQRLGPDYRFETTVVAPGPPAADGSVDALWLVGAGDPLLGTPEYAAYLASQPRSAGTPVTPMAALADQLAAGGVRTVRSGVHGDNSRYDGPQWLPGWKPIYRDEADVGMLSALTVNGGLDHWDPTEVISADPTTLAAAHLARLLVGHGVSVTPGTNQRPNNGVVLARVASAPLSDIVASMLRSSDNLAAELLVKEMDKKAGGTGTTAGGLAIVASTVQRLGIPVAGLHMGDGSGLDPGDRATCPSLLAALNMGDTPGFGAITNGLAVAARSGTLVHRFGGTPLAGHLAAKTGSIDCAVSMVGRLDLKAPLRFALIVNGPCDYNAAIAYEDRVANALATYPE